MTLKYTPGCAPDSDFFNASTIPISYSFLESPKVTISPAQNSDVTPFNTNTFDVADALLDVYPETFTTGLDVSLGGGGGSGFNPGNYQPLVPGKNFSLEFIWSN